MMMMTQNIFTVIEQPYYMTAVSPVSVLDLRYNCPTELWQIGPTSPQVDVGPSSIGNGGTYIKALLKRWQNASI